MSRSNSRSVEDESQRISVVASEALQRGEISHDEFDAVGQLVDGAESAYLEGEIDRAKALEKLHEAEQRLQGAL